MLGAPPRLRVLRVSERPPPRPAAARPPWHIRTVSRLALAAALALACLAPTSAHAYDHQLTLDASAGWGVAPALEAPNHGPSFAIGTTIGFDDAWGLGVYAGWSVHPAFNGGEPYHLGFAGVEGLYFIDILEVVPFFGVGIDVLPTFDGSTNSWGADVAAHLRASVDYLVSRSVAIGLDVRPYVLFSALSTDPFYLTVLARFSYILDY